ncbi:putative Ig domain-containing protein [Ferrimonas marina]|uniref:Putative Ig domain-containing protein n=1 Tax=Ferrimonas marina TaxID=299255 RepID=A0A1M5X877_9GAMM|nr:putative Ig domain-containing protein [Ferrimonas marina]SHH96037.1 Putative Ig domain-containing protein [Ferrimonas marina]
MNQNRFTLSRLALCVSMAIAPAALIATEATDQLTSVGASQNQQVESYVFALTTPAAWAPGGDLNAAEQAQDRIIALAKSLDPKAQVLGRSSKVANTLHLSLSDEAAQALQAHQEVAGVDAVQGARKAQPGAKLNKLVKKAQINEMTEAAPKLSDNPDAGAGVTVAIFSTGIDYTHASLGGAGTAEAYADAYANRTAPYDGFPTDTVIGGHDYASEFNGAIDENPLDGNDELVNINGWEFPTGRGTMLASLIHQQAPGAKFLAYKIGTVYERSWDGAILETVVDRTRLAQAFEEAITEGADIILVDHSLYGGHYAAYYDPKGDNISGAQMETQMVNAAAAKGVTVVTTAGYFGEFPSKYNIATLGAADSALTVGAVETNGADLVTTEWTPHGPVRGSQTIKPDLVSYASTENVALVGTATEFGDEAHYDFTVARIAAAAAIVKGDRDGLSNVEVKALLANTANAMVMRGDSGMQASVTQIGGGVENIDAALSSPVAAWEKGSYQPHLRFGQVTVDGSHRVVKEVSLRNFSEQAQTYSLSMEHAERDGNAALSWSFPASVTVPANTTITVPLVLEIDAASLPSIGLHNSDDYSLENWEKAELNGYLKLTSDSQPTLSLGWAILPKHAGSIQRNFDTFEDVWSDLAHPLPWSFSTATRKQSFTNTSAQNMLATALPVVASRTEIPTDKTNATHLLNHTMAGIYDEAMCSSGKKYVFGAILHQPADISAANYFDKSGDTLLLHKLYFERIVEDYNLAEGIDWEPWLNDEDIFAQVWIAMDPEGKPRSYYTDYNLTYDPSNPYGRYTPSQLPVHFTPGTNQVVGQFCLEELYHHEIDSPDDFDQNLGMIFSTDRDALPDVGDPILMFNPSKWGMQHDDGWGGTQWSTNEVKLNRIDAEGMEGDEWTHQMELAPGESAMLYSQTDGACSSFGIWSDSNINTDASIQAPSFEQCTQAHFVLMDLHSDYSLEATYGMGYDSAYSVAQVTPGQHFIVSEDVSAGSVIGQLALTTPGFFGEVGSEWSPFVVKLMTAIPGNPIEIAEDGTITVANPAALDFENQHTLTFEVMTQMGQNITSKAAEVTISITNVNDVAPIQHGELPSFELIEGNSLELSLASYFSEAEGDAMSFSIEGLPKGLSFEADSLTLSGTVEAAGEYIAKVVVHDGVNSTTAELVITVLAAPALISELPSLSLTEGDAVELSLDGYFADADSDNLMLSVAGLPEGLSFDSDSMMITGTAGSAGDYTVTVTASDGALEASAEMSLSIAAAPAPAPAPVPKSDDGGSLGFALPLLAWLALRRRR